MTCYFIIFDTENGKFKECNHEYNDKGECNINHQRDKKMDKINMITFIDNEKITENNFTELHNNCIPKNFQKDFSKLNLIDKLLDILTYNPVLFYMMYLSKYNP